MAPRRGNAVEVSRKDWLSFFPSLFLFFFSFFFISFFFAPFFGFIRCFSSSFIHHLSIASGYSPVECDACRLPSSDHPVNHSIRQRHLATTSINATHSKVFHCCKNNKKQQQQNTMIDCALLIGPIVTIPLARFFSVTKHGANRIKGFMRLNSPIGKVTTVYSSVLIYVSMYRVAVDTLDFIMDIQ